MFIYILFPVYLVKCSKEFVVLLCTCALVVKLDDSISVSEIVHRANSLKQFRIFRLCLHDKFEDNVRRDANG